MHGDSFVVTISSTGESLPVHVVIPRQGSLLRYDEIYVLVPVGVVIPDKYTVVLEEALEALQVVAAYMLEGKKSGPFEGLGDWVPRPSSE